MERPIVGELSPGRRVVGGAGVPPTALESEEDRAYRAWFESLSAEERAEELRAVFAYAPEPDE